MKKKRDNWKYEGHSINQVNFSKRIATRKHCLQLYHLQGNQYWWFFYFSQDSQHNILYCSPVGYGCRIHRRHLCRGVTHPTSDLDMILSCSETLSFEHRSPVNKNVKQTDCINRGTELLWWTSVSRVSLRDELQRETNFSERKTSVLAWPVHPWFKVVLLLFWARL